MIEYPKMLYKKGFKVLINGEHYDTVIAFDKGEEKNYINEGWVDSVSKKKEEKKDKKETVKKKEVKKEETKKEDK